MERYCSKLIRAVHSRQFPFPSIARYVTELAQLTQIKMFYRLSDILSLKAPKVAIPGQFSDPSCKFICNVIFL